MDRAVEISNELYNKLKDYEEVVGTGVKNRNNASYIIIYLTKASKAILSKIPSQYRGIHVESQITGNFSM
jgi:hypothetical protein